MDLSLFENFQTIISTSLQSILEDVKVQYYNLQEEMDDKVYNLQNLNSCLMKQNKELKEKLDEQTFCEENFNRVSIISNLNKQIKQLKNENDDLLKCLNKKIPINSSLSRRHSISILNQEAVLEEKEEVLEEKEVVLEEKEVVLEEKEVVLEEKEVVLEEKEVVLEEKEVVLEEKEEVLEEKEVVLEDKEVVLEEINYNNKIYYLINKKIYNKKKSGNRGKCVGKIVNGEPKLKKKTN